MYAYVYASTTSLPPQENLFLCTPFVARILTPGHENPAMGFFWGVDQHYIGDPRKQYFFWRYVRTKNWPETRKIFTGCSDPLSLSIGRGGIRREGSLVVRESVTFFREKNAIFILARIFLKSKSIISKCVCVCVFRFLDRKQRFSMENLHFFDRGRANSFWGGRGYKFKAG